MKWKYSDYKMLRAIGPIFHAISRKSVQTPQNSMNMSQSNQSASQSASQLIHIARTESEIQVHWINYAQLIVTFHYKSAFYNGIFHLYAAKLKYTNSSVFLRRVIIFFFC